MDRDVAISKIKKCLALAKSSNANEAATALRQAQKLMAEFNVNDLDIDLADVKEVAQPANSNSIPAWEARLARTVAEAFGCELYLQTGFAITFIGARKKKRDYTFVGVGPAAEIAAYAFKVLSRQCAKDRLAHVQQQPKRLKAQTRTARGDAFAMAWVVAVAKLIERFAGCEHNTELLSAHMAKSHPNMGSVTPKDRHVNRHVRDDSWRAGHQAGQKAQLNRAVDGVASQARIGVNQ